MKLSRRQVFPLLIAAAFLPTPLALGNAPQMVAAYHFGRGAAGAGEIQVAPSVGYSAGAGFGFEDSPVLTDGDGCVTSAKPFYFSIKLPPGNYDVAVSLGDGSTDADTTVKAELRRLMLQNVRTKPGQIETRTFTVNIRTPKVAGDGDVHLKDREKTTEIWDWDDKLTLEFNGQHLSLRSIQISRVDVPTVYLLGDSTVCDQPRESWNSWGQMLPRFFKPGVAVSNQAESGETLRGAIHARRLDKILGDMKRGDYLFVQFGHNDMKEKGAGVGAFTTYKADLEKLVTDTRARGGTPVLVTSMNRKSFDASGHVVNTLKDYPDAVRAVAKEMGVPLIDLNAISKTLYEAIGKANIDKAFVDGTHHNAYGSYELAQCVIEGIRQDKLDLAHFIVEDLPAFDPAHPDPIETFAVPPSPQSSTEKPLGN
jgi:lysophospholipase L1-like esterase